MKRTELSSIKILFVLGSTNVDDIQDELDGLLFGQEMKGSNIDFIGDSMKKESTSVSPNLKDDSKFTPR